MNPPVLVRREGAIWMATEKAKDLPRCFRAQAKPLSAQNYSPIIAINEGRVIDELFPKLCAEHRNTPRQ
ncbi:hypothetical protein HNE05_05075 [Aquipseudomonas campi]|uniref:Uncharacterized protein n=1 Tax=Aquipseudomonas campi TaxID=2731681 RepID=A0A6M8FRM1_9GAMM|nr:hypothetical protein [Pseudomonas campi]QKE62756.1 hypothetical protein HNE05_05075 [Pseudomonas campi]